MSFWLSYAHDLGWAGFGTGSEAGQLYAVYARWYCEKGRGPLHAVHHAAYSSSSSLPQLEYDGRDHKIAKYAPSVVSFRTGIFLQNQGPLLTYVWHVLWAFKVARPLGEGFRARGAIQAHANPYVHNTLLTG